MYITPPRDLFRNKHGTLFLTLTLISLKEENYWLTDRVIAEIEG